MKWKEGIRRTAKRLLTDSSHDYGHTMRVLGTALKIGRKEKADIDVLYAACILHDIGYAKDAKNHEVLGARMARSILEKTDFPSKKIPIVLRCIKNHRFSKNSMVESIEEKILQDADKLDGIGAIGIARCFLWTGERKQSFQIGIGHFREKLLLLKGMMNTKEGKRMAEERHARMLEFLRAVKKEASGR